MRRVTITLLAALTLVGLTACADLPAQPKGAAVAPTAASSAPSRVAQVYAEVLRRYLSTPQENSFPAGTFKVVYVMDTAYPDAASPTGALSHGVPIRADDQRQIVAALAGAVPVRFVSDRTSVIGTKGGCAVVKNGGVLITLGPLSGAGSDTVKVAINGYVACLGATWLTYVVKHDGAGWHVTGTTGSMVIA